MFTRSRTLITFALGALLGGVLAVTVAGASGPPPHTTDVAFVSIPPKALLTNGSVAANGQRELVVIGGSTTVPTNATTVRFEVTVRGAKAGTLSFYPSGNQSGGSGDTLSWVAGGSSTGTIAENVGLRNKMTIANSSLGSAIVTVKITGYSTQVNAAGLNGAGGAAGEVLTNNGAGGTAWATPGRMYSYSAWSMTALTGGVSKTVATLAVPAGTYFVSFTGTVTGNTATNNNVGCSLVAPNGLVVSAGYASPSTASQQQTIPIIGAVTTAGGNFTVTCVDGASNAFFFHPRLTAVLQGAATGAAAGRPGHGPTGASPESR